MEDVTGRLFVDLERRLRREKVGQMGRERLVELLEEVLEPRVVCPVVHLLFSALDPGREGFIDLGALERVVGEVEGGLLEQRLVWLFRMLDTDGSGSLRLGELVETFSDLYEAEGLEQEDAVTRAEQVFLALDPDQEGEVTEHQFVQGCLQDTALVAELVEREEAMEAGGRRPGVQSVESRGTTKRRYSDICHKFVTSPHRCAQRLQKQLRMPR